MYILKFGCFHGVVECEMSLPNILEGENEWVVRLNDEVILEQYELPTPDLSDVKSVTAFQDHIRYVLDMHKACENRTVDTANWVAYLDYEFDLSVIRSDNFEELQEEIDSFGSEQGFMYTLSYMGFKDIAFRRVLK